MRATRPNAAFQIHAILSEKFSTAFALFDLCSKSHSCHRTHLEVMKKFNLLIICLEDKDRKTFEKTNTPLWSQWKIKKEGSTNSEPPIHAA